MSELITPRRWLLPFNALAGWLVYASLDVEPEVAKGLGILCFIALMWLTETLHVSVTALLVPTLAVLAGVFSVKDAFVNFANPIIFLFLGGFALAAGLRKQGLDRFIARQVVCLAGGNLLRACLMLFALAAFLSMWISNTATSAMMLPLALGILSQFDYDKNRPLYLFVLLGIAYSANVGGIGTLVGSPPNAIAAAAIGLDFAGWLKVGLPMVAILLPVMVLVLLLILRPNLNMHFEDQQQAEFKMTSERWRVLVIFAVTVLMWLCSKPISQGLGISKGMDSITALIAIVLLCASRVVQWKDIEKSTEWGVLLLFGGGITLSALLKTTGASLFLASQVSQLVAGTGLFLFLLMLVSFVVFLTELASNTASTALLVPIFISIAQEMGLPPTTLAIAIAIAASCAFMLPVATPPNAIVFGTGWVPQRDMMRVGIVLNLVCIATVTVLVGMLL